MIEEEFGGGRRKLEDGRRVGSWVKMGGGKRRKTASRRNLCGMSTSKHDKRRERRKGEPPQRMGGDKKSKERGGDRRKKRRPDREKDKRKQNEQCRTGKRGSLNNDAAPRGGCTRKVRERGRKFIRDMWPCATPPPLLIEEE